MQLNSPTKIQDYINKIPFNHEEDGESYQSVERTLTLKKAHCFEGALVAAAALWAHGEKPLLLDLVTTEDDDDHVVTLFKRDGLWGAISKTNHAVLRFREPIYRDIRELVLSYFHEYFLYDGTKTLRAFSKPFDLSRKGMAWLTTNEDLIDLVDELHHSPHEKILTKIQEKKLRKADKLERQVMESTEYALKRKNKRKSSLSTKGRQKGK